MSSSVLAMPRSSCACSKSARAARRGAGSPRRGARSRGRGARCGVCAAPPLRAKVEPEGARRASRGTRRSASLVAPERPAGRRRSGGAPRAAGLVRPRRPRSSEREALRVELRRLRVGVVRARDVRRPRGTSGGRERERPPCSRCRASISRYSSLRPHALAEREPLGDRLVVASARCARGVEPARAPRARGCA